MAAERSDAAYWRLCPRCQQPTDNGYELQTHLQQEHRLSKEQAVEESVAVMRAGKVAP